MTWKRVVFDDHAQERMHERGIQRAEVRWLLARGIRKLERSSQDREIRWSCRGYLGHREAKVVFVEAHDRIVLVTVEWTDERPATTE